jgi:hypothetical protein
MAKIKNGQPRMIAAIPHLHLSQESLVALGQRGKIIELRLFGCRAESPTTISERLLEAGWKSGFDRFQPFSKGFFSLAVGFEPLA